MKNLQVVLSCAGPPVIGRGVNKEKFMLGGCMEKERTWKDFLGRGVEVDGKWMESGWKVE